MTYAVSSAEAERLFSVYNFIRNNRRLRLHPLSIEANLQIELNDEPYCVFNGGIYSYLHRKKHYPSGFTNNEK
jgi:hypothetical protein